MWKLYIKLFEYPFVDIKSICVVWEAHWYGVVGGSIHANKIQRLIYCTSIYCCKVLILQIFYIEWASLITGCCSIRASAATVSTKAEFETILHIALSLITETEWRTYASADLIIISSYNGVYDVHTFSGGWRWIYKDMFNKVNPGYFSLAAIARKPQHLSMFLHIFARAWGRQWSPHTSEQKGSMLKPR